MTLGDLKKSLTRFPPDMDDTEIIIQYGDNQGKVESDLLTFVAYANYQENVTAIILGTWKVADIMQEKDPSKFPEKYQPRPAINPNSPESKEYEEE